MSPAPPRWELRPGCTGYPSLLAATPRPPDPLYVMGDPISLMEGFAVVGARKATPYGLRCASWLAGHAARRGVTIISGAAIGCDQAAQRAALAAGGNVVSVLGCGADVDYPSSARDLLALLRRDGAVVSEQPWGSPPQRWAFRERNRIIAGLSRAVLVVEASLPSGTFSTADFALDAGREVLAVPGSIFAPECRGPNRLIKQGAYPVTGTDDLDDVLQAVGFENLLPEVRLPDDDGLHATEDDTLRALLADPMRPDDLAMALRLPVAQVLRRVASLEAAGLVHRYPDGRYGPG